MGLPPAWRLSMRLAAVKELSPGERRVALAPASIAALAKAGWEVQIEAGAGEAAGFTDAQYLDKGATVVTRDEALAADVIAAVRVTDPQVFARLAASQVLVAQLD